MFSSKDVPEQGLRHDERDLFVIELVGVKGQHRLFSRPLETQSPIHVNSEIQAEDKVGECVLDL